MMKGIKNLLKENRCGENLISLIYFRLIKRPKKFCRKILIPELKPKNNRWNKTGKPNLKMKKFLDKSKWPNQKKRLLQEKNPAKKEAEEKRKLEKIKKNTKKTKTSLSRI